MKRKNTTRSALCMSIISMLLCVSMLVGTTFAWFTDEVKSGVNQIVAGNLDIELYYATQSDVVNGAIADEEWIPVTADAPVFNKDALWEPGYTEVVYLKAVNKGTLSLRYHMNVRIDKEEPGVNKAGETFNLSDYIQAYAIQAADYQFSPLTSRQVASDPLSLNIGAPDPFSDTLANASQGNYDGFETGVYDSLSLNLSQWLEPAEEWYTTLVLFMPTTVGNEANHNGVNVPKIELGLNVVATQYNWDPEDDSFGPDYDKDAEYPATVDIWDGTVDTTWYNDTDTEFVITTSEQLAGLAELVDDGNNFAGRTIKLGSDLDLASLPFNPVGHSSNGKSFNGTFDGQGHTISNMYEQSDLSAWQYEGEYYGLFAYTNGAIIKNVTVADAYISSGRNEAAGVVGNAVDTTFSDITISSTTLIAYNNSAGGVAAECYGNCSFTNIVVDEDTVIGPLWGTYDVRLGGVVGLVHAGNNVTFSNITVACKLDAINDVAANYQYWLYRYCGMLIGHVDGVNGVADPTGYVTCENVKVIYGDWVNYHYCEFESLGAGSYNGPGEYKYARVEPGTGTDGIDLSTCNHDADESHNVLIVFDQLFGGGQGVKGLKTYDGVTVVYPNN